MPADVLSAFDLPPWLDQPLARAALILASSLLFMAFVDIVFRRVLTRMTRRTATDLDDRAVPLMRQPLAVTVLLIGLYAALAQFDLRAGLLRAFSSLLVTVAVLHWFMAFWRMTRIILEAMGNVAHAGGGGLLQRRTLPAFEVAAKVLLVGALSYFLLLAWGIDVTGWLASAGIVGIAVGFAAKDTLANLFAGLSILADAPYKPGDYLVLDNGSRGRVSEIGLRSTRLLTCDGVEIIIPNSVMAGTRIVNESGGPHERQRVRISVGVAYGSDIDHVRAVLLDVAAHAGDLLRDDPEALPQVRFRSFGDSGLALELLVWVATPERLGIVRDELNSAIYKRFAIEHIEIPYPTREVFLRGLPAGFGASFPPE